MSVKPEVSTTETGIPAWVPKGHPHMWTEEEWDGYEEQCEPLTQDIWKAIDNVVWCRECTVPECDEPGHGVESDPLPPRIVVDDWRAPSYDADAPFEPNDWVQPGDPSKWSEEEWNVHGDLTDQLPDELATMVDDAMLDRMLEYDPRSVHEVPDTKPTEPDNNRLNYLLSIPINKMTDAEYAELETFADDDDDSYTVPVPTSIVVAGKGSDPERPYAEKQPCECDGPNDDGSGGKGTYKSHMFNCVWSPKFEVKECKCQGPWPGSGKFKTHTPSCPSYIKPLGKITSSTSSFVSVPSCKHDRTLFELENGLSIYASAYRDIKYLDDERVNIGVYMYSSWKQDLLTTPGLELPWAEPSLTKAVYLDWPDFSVPDKSLPMVKVVQWMLDTLTEGTTMETGCMGGHGRTGTMLALLLVAQGLTPPEAIERVRDKHCSRGIENKRQCEYVASFYEAFHGNTAWRKSKSLRKRFNTACGASVKQTTGVTTGYKSGGSGSWSGGFNSGKVWDHDKKSWVQEADLPIPAGGSRTWQQGLSWDKDAKCYMPKGGETL